jgi:molybdate transport system ATP-binding protein
MSAPVRIELAFVLEQDGFVLDIEHQGDSRVLALFGPSGSGKTTCLEAIAGLRTPSRGRIAIAGRELYASVRRHDLAPRLRGVGYVPQDALLFPHLDVRGNVLFGAGRRRASPQGASGDRRFALDDVLGIVEAGALIDRPVSALSGGERQRVSLARALMSSPDVLLLDEPLAAIDLPLRRRIVSSLRRIRDELGVPVIYVTHDPAELRTIADTVIVLDEGRVVGAGSPESVGPGP